MKKIPKRRRTVGRGIEELWKREVGELPPRTFAHRIWASEDLVLRLDIHKTLAEHRGCVNTVSFNQAGGILISGSDDRMIMLWNWDAGCVKLSFDSGHTDNVFQAKIMSYSDDRSVVTCAADGQVRHALIREDGQVETKNLGKHRGRVHQLAIEPGSPHIFYSCGEDGLVQHFDLRTRAATALFTCHSFHDNSQYVPIPIVQLNAIAIDPRNPNIFGIAGSDEYARLYDIRKCNLDGSTNYGHPVDCFCPKHLVGDDEVGITGLAFSDQSELLVSYNDEQIYLFSRDLGLGPDPVPASQSSPDAIAGTGLDPSNLDIDAKTGPQVYKGHQNHATVKGPSFFGPNCEYVVSGSDCGRIFIWRKKDGELLRVMPADTHVVNCVECHPHAAILASSGIEHDIKMWTPKATERASLPANVEEVLMPSQIALFAINDDDDDFIVDDDDDNDDEDDDDDDEDDNDGDDSNDDDDGDNDADACFDKSFL
eukprot:TRINITY_DN1200_c0_g1_i1.p1 TRINITY_DN1200_c0_g1~~TRINITY_DN1200_c0_g1_i1.p1  ORF type:complete len:482 (+),score=100.46 TRINITY_DN1200_c0_g1_i1:297-1742(+)